MKLDYNLINIIFFIIIIILLIVVVYLYNKNNQKNINKDNKVLLSSVDKYEVDTSIYKIVNNDNNENNENNENNNNENNNNKDNNKDNNQGKIQYVYKPKIIDDNDFQITNVKITDKFGESKNVLHYNEPIFIVFNYKLPKGLYHFRVIPNMSVMKEYNFRPDTLRSGSGNLQETPFIIKIYGTDNDDSIKMDEIKILVYKAGTYDLPVFTKIHKINITIENKKVTTNEDLLKDEKNNSKNLINKNSAPVPSNKYSNKLLSNSKLADNSSSVNLLDDNIKELCDKVEQQILALKSNPIQEDSIYFKQIEMILPELEKCKQKRPDIVIFDEILKEYETYQKRNNSLNNQGNDLGNNLLNNQGKNLGNNLLNNQGNNLGNNSLNNQGNDLGNNTNSNIRQNTMVEQNNFQQMIQNTNTLIPEINENNNDQINLGIKEEIINQLKNTYNNEENIVRTNSVEAFHNRFYHAY